MNSTTTLKNNTIKKTNSKKLRIQRNRNLATLFIFISILFISITSIKNIYVSYRCSDLIYAVDYYFTSWNDTDFRLISVDSIAVVSNNDNKVEIEAYGFSYKKPYNKTYLIGTFTEDTKGRWSMTSVRLKDDLTETLITE